MSLATFAQTIRRTRFGQELESAVVSEASRQADRARAWIARRLPSGDTSTTGTTTAPGSTEGTGSGSLAPILVGVVVVLFLLK